MPTCPEGVGVDVHVGRQPVFDRQRRVVGHELLFRDSDVQGASFSSGSAATARVLLTSFLDIGLAELVGTGLAFVNLPRPYLVGEVALPMGPGQLVLEVLEDVGHDAEVLEGVRALRAQGHRLALDDFVWTPQSALLLPEVDLVKVDVLQHGADVPALVRRIQARGPRVLAEKVETAEQLRVCEDLGVDLYQGYLLQRPEVLRGRSLSPGQATCLELVRVLATSEVSMLEVAAVVRRDASLVYRLMRAANSAGAGASHRVTGLREALAMLGFAQLRRWALLLLVADLPQEAGAGVEAALLRAGMCEQLAGRLPGADGSEAFVVGLVSSLSGLLCRPLPDLLRLLPLAASTEAALLDHLGPLGQVLACVKAYERGELAVPVGSGLSEQAPRECFLAAVRATTPQQAVLAA